MLQIHASQYPIWSQMALDYLPIQGSAVPCERKFSSAGITGTDRRNRLTPATFEALQILKAAYMDGLQEGELEGAENIHSMEVEEF